MACVVAEKENGNESLESWLGKESGATFVIAIGLVTTGLVAGARYVWASASRAFALLSVRVYECLTQPYSDTET